MRRTLQFGLILLLATVLCTGWLLRPVRAAGGDFSLQITPSPLVTTMRPGDKSTLQLKIRNAGTGSEDLKIEPRSFTINSHNGHVELNDATPPDIASWISFGAPKFTVQPGQWYTEDVNIALPKASGFSYSFALVISRQKLPQPTSAGQLLNGAVAVFTLVNVDRPGATAKLSVASFAISKHVYEYLPAQLSLSLKNTGNTIVQPFGNIFIGRGSSGTPLATLPVNDSHGYILPGVSRTLTTDWNGGFPHYVTTTDANGAAHQKLVWNWSDLSKFRIGRYSARLVAVYSDAGRDVPLVGQVSFWVFPWKIVLALIVFAALTLFGLWSLIRKIISVIRRLNAKRSRP